MTKCSVSRGRLVADIKNSSLVVGLSRLGGFFHSTPDWSPSLLLSPTRVLKNGRYVTSESRSNSLARQVNIGNRRIAIKGLRAHRQPFLQEYK